MEIPGVFVRLELYTPHFPHMLQGEGRDSFPWERNAVNQCEDWEPLPHLFYCVACKQSNDAVAGAIPTLKLAYNVGNCLIVLLTRWGWGFIKRVIWRV